MTSKKIDPKNDRLESFLKSHGLHLLGDAKQGISVGSLYTKYPNKSISNDIGNVNNFIIPPIELPKPNTGKKNIISENFRMHRSLNIFAKAITSFISSFGVSLKLEEDQILELTYNNVTYEKVDRVVIANLIANHSLNIKNFYFKPENEYYIVSEINKSSNFKIYVKITKGLRAALKASGGQPVLEGDFKVEYGEGNLDEATFSYIGKKPVVFAVHLEILEFNKKNGMIIDMYPLENSTKLLAEEPFIWK